MIKMKQRSKQFKVVNDKLLKHFTQEQLNNLDFNIDIFTNDDLNYSLHERMCAIRATN